MYRASKRSFRCLACIAFLLVVADCGAAAGATSASDAAQLVSRLLLHQHRASSTAEKQEHDRASFQFPEYKLVNLFDSNFQKKTFFAEETETAGAGNAKYPVVFMHGMGDSGSNPGMRGLCAETARKYNVYVLCLDVADGVASITTKMDDQLLAFVQVVQKDAKLKNGFNLMGNSQGGLLSRAYIERWNNPPVRRFVSLDGTQHGIATCPTSLSWACPLFTRVLNPYSTPLVFSDYWRDPSDKAKFLAESRFLADVGNDRAAKNATYAANMRSLDGYVMIEATRDSMVHPHESESHGFYAWGEPTKVETMTETQAYQEDWIGLRTLHEANKLVFLKYAGEHMQVPPEMLHEMVLPYLGGENPFHLGKNQAEVRGESLRQSEVADRVMERNSDIFSGQQSDLYV